MLTEIKPTIVIPDTTYTEAAMAVAEWTLKAKTTLQKTPEQILLMFEKGWSVLLVGAESKMPIAHAAITYAWPENWLEVGTLVVVESERQKGYGKQVTAAVLELARTRYPGSRIFALCNNFSLPIFDKFGGTRMKYDELPDEVFKECRLSCPNFLTAKAQGMVCCDTPVNLSQLKI